MFKNDISRRNFLKRTAVFTLSAAGISLAKDPNEKPKEAKLKKRALIVTGQSNQWHDWSASTPILKKYLEETKIFKVDLAISPPKGAAAEEMAKFKPAFMAYDLVVLDYDGDEWCKETKGRFEKFVREGGGVVVVHAADNAFPNWKEYNEIIGLGGWGGRNEKSGPMVRWREGKMVLDYKPGAAGIHPAAHDFVVVDRDTKHPVTKGLPVSWMHAKDEIYSKLRGPAINLAVLSTAYCDPKLEHGTGENEPVLFAVKYGNGRVFHDVLGHVGTKDEDVPPAFRCVGFITTFQRGAEWAATGKVTQPVPKDFPTAEKTSLRPATKIERIKS